MVFLTVTSYLTVSHRHRQVRAHAELLPLAARRATTSSTPSREHFRPGGSPCPVKSQKYGKRVNNIPRAPRRQSLIKAHLRVGDEWIEVGVGNVSLTGLMVRFPGMPAVGTQMELRRRGVAIIGEVVWSTLTRFEMRSFSEIDQAALLEAGLQQKSHALPPERPRFWHWRKTR
jgi:hypothetical protein